MSDGPQTLLEPGTWPVAYAPYPLNVVRDWLQRRRNWVRLALVVALGAGLGPGAYRLWTMRTVRPPNAGEEMYPFGSSILWVSVRPGLNIPPAGIDRTADLLAAIQALPERPEVDPTTAPAGKQWITWKDYKVFQSNTHLFEFKPPQATVTCDPPVIRAGPWIPNRLHLREAIKYLELPATRSALARIRELSGQPHCLETEPFEFSHKGPRGARALRDVGLILVARARYDIMAHRDFQAAAEDIETVLRLAEGTEDDGTFCCLGNTVYRIAAYVEMACWGREKLPSREQALDLIRRIEAHRRDLTKVWHVALEGERRVCADMLDGCYAPGESGRYVLHQPGKGAGDWVLGSLNLFSVFLADRQEANTHFGQLSHVLEAGDPSPAELARRERGIIKWALSHPLHPFGKRISMMDMGHERELLLNEQALEAGAITSLALGAYHVEHGKFPRRLTELVPTYLKKLPADPFSSQPLKYRMHTDGSFILYSIGVDGIDNGGPLKYSVKEQRYLDPIVCQPRYADPEPEWVLVPVGPRASR